MERLDARRLRATNKQIRCDGCQLCQDREVFQDGLAVSERQLRYVRLRAKHGGLICC